MLHAMPVQCVFVQRSMPCWIVIVVVNNHVGCSNHLNGAHDFQRDARYNIQASRWADGFENELLNVTCYHASCRIVLLRTQIHHITIRHVAAVPNSSTKLHSRRLEALVPNRMIARCPSGVWRRRIQRRIAESQSRLQNSSGPSPTLRGSA
jgi:hypothetical protein